MMAVMEIYLDKGMAEMDYRLMMVVMECTLLFGDKNHSVRMTDNLLID